jgi:hypothetical protein
VCGAIARRMGMSRIDSPAGGICGSDRRDYHSPGNVLVRAAATRFKNRGAELGEPPESDHTQSEEPPGGFITNRVLRYSADPSLERTTTMKLCTCIMVMALTSQLLASPVIAGTYLVSSTLDTYVAVEDNSQTTFSIVPYGGTTNTGNVSGSGASYSNTDSAQVLNLLPYPLYPGVGTYSETSGSTNPDAPNSSVNSSASIISRTYIVSNSYEEIYISATYAMTLSVQPASTSENMSVFADIGLYFDGTKVYTTSATIGSFNTGLPGSENYDGSTGDIFLLLHPGINELDSIPYAYGQSSVSTASGPPPPPPPSPSVPEPSSLVLSLGAIISIGACVALRRNTSTGRHLAAGCTSRSMG